MGKARMLAVMAIAAVLLVSLTACGGNDTSESTSETQDSQSESTQDQGTDAGSGSTDSEAAPQPSKRVKAMQEELKEAGFYTGAIDGIYGADTAAAIKAAQKKAGLTEDGIYGPLTHDAVISMITGTAASSSNPGESEHMRLLQSDLKNLGYYEGEPDALYGPKTEAAVKAFQKDQGLPVTGQIDPETEAALTAAMENFAN